MRLAIVSDRRVAFALLVAAALGWAGVVRAATPSPSSSAVQQYVEMVPTASGVKPAGSTQAPASSAAQQYVEVVPTSKGAQPVGSSAKLTQIATSPALGAPTTGLRLGAGQRAASPGVLSAAGGAISNGRLAGLVAALGVMTLLAVGRALRGR